MSETSSMPGSPVSTTGSSVREENPTPSITVSSGASAPEHLNQMNLNDSVPDHTPDGTTLPNVTPADVVVSTVVSSGGLLQEDTEMEDAPVANEPEGLEATGTNESTATATSSKKSDPVNALKKLIYRRDRFFSLMADMVTTDSADPKAKQHLRELREQINDMNKDISVMKHSLRLSLEKVTFNSNDSVNETNGDAKIASVAGAGGIRLNRHDLPKFQLKPSNQKYFPKEESFESVNHFLRSFEKVVSSSGEDINVVWKRYIPLTLHYDLDAWLRDELLVCPSWSAASSMFVKKFGNNAVLKLQSRREVFSAVMKINETTDEYSARFKKAASEAGYSADNSTIGDAFLMGFPKEWQSQINTLLHCTYPDRDYWTTDEISTAALNIFNNDTISLSFVGKSRGLSSTGGDQANKGVKRAKTESYYCPNHGGTAARHNEKDCIKNKGGSSFTGNSSSNSMPQQVSKPKFLGNKNSPHSATGNTFCTWCGKLWVMGHSCPEYFEKKQREKRACLDNS